MMACSLSPIAWRASRASVCLVNLGYEVFPRDQRTLESLSAPQKADAEKWWPFIKEFGIKAE